MVFHESLYRNIPAIRYMQISLILQVEQNLNVLKSETLVKIIMSPYGMIQKLDVSVAELNMP